MVSGFPPRRPSWTPRGPATPGTGRSTCGVTTQPFRSIDGMRRALLDVWRHTVGENDTIIYLGDVTVGPPADAVDEALAALPGLTLLVRRSATASYQGSSPTVHRSGFTPPLRPRP